MHFLEQIVPWGRNRVGLMPHRTHSSVVAFSWSSVLEHSFIVWLGNSSPCCQALLSNAFIFLQLLWKHISDTWVCEGWAFLNFWWETVGKFQHFDNFLAGWSILCACVGDPGSSVRKYKVNSSCFSCNEVLICFLVFVCYTVQVNVLLELLWECLIKDKLQ